MATIFGDQGCVDPRQLAHWCAAQTPPIPTDRWWGKANSFSTGPGREPGAGWVLLTLGSLNALLDTVDQTLTFSGTDPAHVVPLCPVTLLDRECITPGAPNDPASVYLCKVVDRRHLLGMIPLDAAYNLRTADGTAFFTQTTNGGTAWTWQGVVGDIATALGLSLTLPFTPNGEPENLVYWGQPSALTCLCDLLSRLACDLTYDPVADVFGIVRLGESADAVLNAVSAGRTWDGYSAEPARAWRPESIRVRFPRRPVDTASGYSPYYTVDVTLAGAEGVQPGTFVQIEDGLSALGSTGAPTNSTALTTQANERAADWLRKRQFYDRPVLRAWYDFLPTAPGLGGYAVRKVVFDDRGAAMQTVARAEPDGALEAWKPLGGWPVWYPLTESSGGGGGVAGDVIGPDGTLTGTVAVYVDPSGRIIGNADGLTYTYSQDYNHPLVQLCLALPGDDFRGVATNSNVRKPSPYISLNVFDVSLSQVLSFDNTKHVNVDREVYLEEGGLTSGGEDSHRGYAQFYQGQLVRYYEQFFFVSDAIAAQIYTEFNATAGTVIRTHGSSTSGPFGLQYWMVHYDHKGNQGLTVGNFSDGLLTAQLAALTPLAGTAALSDVITAVNAIIAALSASGITH